MQTTSDFLGQTAWFFGNVQNSRIAANCYDIGYSHGHFLATHPGEGLFTRTYDRNSVCGVAYWTGFDAGLRSG